MSQIKKHQNFFFLYCCLITALISACGFLFTGEKKALIKDDITFIAGPEYAETVLPLLKSAKKKIYIAMYVMSYQPKRHYAIENKFVEALIEAHRKGVEVKVVLDASREWNPKTRRMDGKESKKNQKSFNALKKAGVPVFYDTLDQIMHAKSIQIDERMVILGSTNWTYSALKKNVEFSIILKTPKELRIYKKHFLKLWDAAKNKKKWNP